MTNKQTRKEFEKAYCQNSGITVAQFRKECVVLPCECSDEECPGWAAVKATPMSINTHMELYFPAPQVAVPTERPINCREALIERGECYPKSNCAICGSILRSNGCPFGGRND